MRKTKIVLIALISICLFVISGTFIGYSVTYGKYVEQKKSDNNSSVAIFGISMTWSNNAFLTEYEKGTPSRFAVQANSKSLAPGISNNIVLSLRGKCEIAFNLTIEIDEIYSEHWKESGLTTADTYYPIKLTARSSTSGSLSVENNVISVNYAAVGADINEDIIITWTWQPNINNDADTYMGSLSDVATYSLEMEAIATQIN